MAMSGGGTLPLPNLRGQIDPPVGIRRDFLNGVREDLLFPIAISTLFAVSSVVTKTDLMYSALRRAWR
jgi:hypothetical protein